MVKLCSSKSLYLTCLQAGFFPAATYLLTCWYCRHELQSRLATFFSAGSMAGAFSGLLAYAIAKMDGVANLAGWRWSVIRICIPETKAKWPQDYVA